MRRCGERALRVSVIARAAALLIPFCALLPAPALAQCMPPNLTVNDATCVAGQECQVSVDLDTNGDLFAAVAATMRSSGDISCDFCAPGAQAGGICILNPVTCAWNVSDFSLQPFSDGEVGVITMSCATPGSYSLDLFDVSLGKTNGTPQLSCGVGGVLTCVTCIADAECDDSNACTANDACAAGACTREDYCGVPVSRGADPVASDALFTLRAAIGSENCPSCECDVNSNGSTTASDALAILQKSVGLSVLLNCFAPEPL